MTSEETKNLLALSFLKGVGRKTLLELANTAKFSEDSLIALFLSKKQFNKKFLTSNIEEAILKAEYQIKVAEKNNHKIISYLDFEYPDSLRMIDDPPVILFCSGNIELLKKNGVSIIGTREPTAHGLEIAKKLTYWSINNGWVVTSGLAKGIDTQAHQECINSDGLTIAVLAHGLEKIYPAENKLLASKILDNNGLLISEYCYESFIGKSNFVERDRIQAALSKAVILVQSSLSGGSLHASRAALKYGRFLVIAGQSKTDEIENPDKIAANVALLKGSDFDKSKLLKQPIGKLKYLIALHHKEFYHLAQEKINNHLLTSNKPEAKSLL